jgi:hypothetical protein
MVETIKKLRNSTMDIEEVLVANKEGLAIAHTMSSESESEKLGAMAANLLGIGERTLEVLDKGDLLQVFTKGSNGYVLVTEAGPDAVLAVTTNSKARLGLIFFEAKNAALSIAEKLRS